MREGRIEEPQSKGGRRRERSGPNRAYGKVAGRTNKGLSEGGGERVQKRKTDIRSERMSLGAFMNADSRPVIDARISENARNALCAPGRRTELHAVLIETLGRMVAAWVGLGKGGLGKRGWRARVMEWNGRGEPENRQVRMGEVHAREDACDVGLRQTRTRTQMGGREWDKVGGASGEGNNWDLRARRGRWEMWNRGVVKRWRGKQGEDGRGE
ncbi:hypothetical protein DFH09DRAFT_1291830 [Mycena vulgaris]|nr:hypothetical protein DFH09DRAFT_1291830 [Mycena vulgaris]